MDKKTPQPKKDAVQVNTSKKPWAEAHRDKLKKSK